MNGRRYVSIIAIVLSVCSVAATLYTRRQLREANEWAEMLQRLGQQQSDRAWDYAMQAKDCEVNLRRTTDLLPVPERHQGPQR